MNLIYSQRLLTLILIAVGAWLMQPCFGHQIQQVVLMLDEREDRVEARVMVDAAYCLPGFRGDVDKPAPGWRWFEKLTKEELAELHREAERFLREALVLELNMNPISWDFSVIGTSPVDRGEPTLTIGLSLKPTEHEGMLRGEWKDRFPTVLTVYTSSRNGLSEIVQLNPGMPRDLMRWPIFQAAVAADTAKEKVGKSAKTNDGEKKHASSPKGGFWLFLKIGFYHILPAGLDHIAFVLGLFFLQQAWRPLLRQTLAFTLGHSLSLAAVAAGWLNPPSAWVEPLIAASLIWVGIENLRSKDLQPMRLIVVGLIGFVHGLGFGNALINYLHDAFLIPLIGFNLGVELGQIAVIGFGFLLYVCVRKRFGGVRAAGSLAVSAFGLFLLVERLLPNAR